MKKRLKRWWISFNLAITRKDVCSKHWIEKRRDVAHGMYGQITKYICSVCEEEEEKMREEFKTFEANRKREFLDALSVLRKEYLN